MVGFAYRILVILGGLYLSGLQAAGGGPNDNAIEIDANLFSMSFVDQRNNQVVKMSQFREPQIVAGKALPLIVVFWATWCKSCKNELRGFKTKVGQAAHPPVLAINLDRNHSKAVRFLEKLALPFISLADKDQTLKKLFKVQTLPAHYRLQIDAAGNWQATLY